MRKHLGKMFAEQKEPTRIYEDNAAAVRLAERGSGPRSLHWDVKLEYVTELQKLKYVEVRKVDTRKQIADVLTKPLPADQHLVCAGALLGSSIVFSSAHGAMEFDEDVDARDIQGVCQPTRRRV